MGIRILVVLSVAIGLSGCARYEEWQLLQKKDEAAGVLLSQCNAGNMDACAYVTSIRGRMR